MRSYPDFLQSKIQTYGPMFRTKGVTNLTPRYSSMNYKDTEV